MSEQRSGGDSVTLIERQRAADLQKSLQIMVQASGKGYAIVDYDSLADLENRLIDAERDYVSVLELRESERSKDLDASKVGGAEAGDGSISLDLETIAGALEDANLTICGEWGEWDEWYAAWEALARVLASTTRGSASLPDPVPVESDRQSGESRGLQTASAVVVEDGELLVYVRKTYGEEAEAQFAKVLGDDATPRFQAAVRRSLIHEAICTTAALPPPESGSSGLGSASALEVEADWTAVACSCVEGSIGRSHERTCDRYLALNKLGPWAVAATKPEASPSPESESAGDGAAIRPRVEEEIDVALNHLADFAGRFQTTLTQFDAQVLVEYIQEATEILLDCTAFRDMNTLHRHRAFLGGPDMRLHHRRCRLFGDGRVECHEGCPASTTTAEPSPSPESPYGHDPFARGDLKPSRPVSTDEEEGQDG